MILVILVFDILHNLGRKFAVILQHPKVVTEPVRVVLVESPGRNLRLKQLVDFLQGTALHVMLTYDVRLG